MEEESKETSNENSNLHLKAIYTPGHISDHMSFHLTHSGPSEPATFLFSGDIILGSPSAVIEDLPTYMRTLKMLQDREDYHFDYVCVPHSVSLEENDVDTVIMDGPSKLAAYI